MTRGRAFSILCGAALLGGIAAFNEMTPLARAAFIDGATGTATSLIDTAVVAWHGLTAATEPVAPAARPAHPGADDASAPSRATHTADAAADQPSGNPLWALPLKQLSNTRERPIFSPSRRPPPPPRAIVAPVAIQQPAKPPEPERPKVSLLGTIIGTSQDDRIAVFIEAGTQTVVRLRIGEDHDGWVLRLVKAREATLVKEDNDAVVLELPTPGEAPPPGLAGNFPTTLPPAPPVQLQKPAAQPATPAQPKRQRR